ncbi:MAG: hypothetical protein NVS9B15_02110 [Acidobacteriaceae bacterium]
MEPMVFPPTRYLPIVGLVIVTAGSIAAYVLRRKPLLPAEIERLRREFLNLHGRILDGTILDFHEVPDACDPNAPATQLLTYSYEISGVQYEAAQDVTDLRQYVDVHECRLGLPTSVRYDPHRPQNSMVVSEQWTGLRTGMLHPKAAPSTLATKREEDLRPHPDRLFAQTQ